MITTKDKRAVGFSAKQISPFLTVMNEKFSYFCFSTLDSHFGVLSLFS